MPAAPSPADAPPTYRPPGWLKVAPLILVATGLLAYANSFTGPLLFDDLTNIRTNFALRRLWPIWQTMWGPAGTGVAGRPVVQLSFAVNYALHGLDVRGYHVGNLLLHLLTSLALFGMLRRTFSSPRLAATFGKSASTLALTSAVLWQVHPLLTDSVTYLSGRSEILVALFLLLTLYCVIRSTVSTRHATTWWAMAIASCAIGTGCKEIIAVAPLLALLYDRTFVADSYRQLLRERRGLYIGLFATWLLIPLNLYMANFHRWALRPQETLGSWDYLKIQSHVLVHYLRLSVWPHPLLIDYQGWSHAPSLLAALPQAILILALLAMTVYGVARARPWAFAGAWCLLILAPTSSLLPLPTEIATERRMYLPLMALVALAVATIARFCLRRGEFRAPTLRHGGAALLVMIVAAEVAGAHLRNRDYRDTTEMWKDVAARQPQNDRALTNIGVAYLDAGDQATAEQYFRRALEVEPDNFTALNNLGNIALRRGDDDAAVRLYSRAIKAKPDYASPYSNLAIIDLKRGHLASAEANFRTSVRLQPNRMDFLAKLSRVLNAAGKHDEAAEVARSAIAVDATHVPAYEELGSAMAALGHFGEAVEAYRSAVRYGPSDVSNRLRLAWHLCLASPPTGNPGEALSLAHSVVDQSSPAGNSMLALDTLAFAHAANGDFDNAVQTATRALQAARQANSSRAKAIEARLKAYTGRRMPDPGSSQMRG